MNLQRQDFKNLFKSNLEPFLEMLENKQNNIDPHKWRERVARLAACVAGNPEQYVGAVMPLKNIAVEIIHDIFEDFVREHSFPEAGVLL